MGFHNQRVRWTISVLDSCRIRQRNKKEKQELFRRVKARKGKIKNARLRYALTAMKFANYSIQGHC